MKIQIKSRYTNVIMHEYEEESLKIAVVKSVKSGADLRGADLGGAYLYRADLRGADLRRAYLRGADLRGAYLRGAYLRGAYLRGADLRGAYLGGADLRGADLYRADLGGADLYRADLGGAYLRGADLRGADLRGAEQYSESHDVFCELVRIQKSSAFTTKEWEFIAHISIHRICWDTITGKFRNAAMRVFKKLAKAGHNEYLKKFQKVTK